MIDLVLLEASSIKNQLQLHKSSSLKGFESESYLTRGDKNWLQGFQAKIQLVLGAFGTLSKFSSWVCYIVFDTTESVIHLSLALEVVLYSLHCI